MNVEDAIDAEIMRAASELAGFSDPRWRLPALTAPHHEFRRELIRQLRREVARYVVRGAINRATRAAMVDQGLDPDGLETWTDCVMAERPPHA